MSELLLSMMVLGLAMVGQGGAGCFLRVVIETRLAFVYAKKFAEFPHPTSKTRPPSPRGRRDKGECLVLISALDIYRFLALTLIRPSGTFSPQGRRDSGGSSRERERPDLLTHLAFDRLSGGFFFLFQRRTLLCKRAVYRAWPWAWELRQMF
jgi:hypothetical protein